MVVERQDERSRRSCLRIQLPLASATQVPLYLHLYIFKLDSAAETYTYLHLIILIAKMLHDGTATTNLHTTTTSILASPGILSIICSHCSQATLLSLSTTCQSVSTAALQQLWARLEWFGALIYTLPSDAWRATETDRAVTLVSVPRCCENGNEM